MILALSFGVAELALVVADERADHARGSRTRGLRLAPEGDVGREQCPVGCAPVDRLLRMLAEPVAQEVGPGKLRVAHSLATEQFHVEGFEPVERREHDGQDTFGG